jgi:arylformamidase
MIVIDLTHEIHEEMPVFPGMSKPKVEEAFYVTRDGYKETMLTLLSHTGTHMDAPAHMLEDGMTLDQYPINAFIGLATILDARGMKEISLGFLNIHERKIMNSDFILICTGWSQFWGTQAYFRNFPVLTSEAAKWISALGKKAVGSDTISADLAESIEFPVHRQLFAKDMFIIENLNQLEQLVGKEVMFSCLPLRFLNADGSPVRAIAWY